MGVPKRAPDIAKAKETAVQDRMSDGEVCGGLSRRDFLAAMGAGLAMLGVGLNVGVRPAEAALNLDVVRAGYPRAFFFRQAEGSARGGDLTYAEWEGKYAALGGIVGKVLNEEFDYTGTDLLPFFRRFKAENPTKMVLLHYNGAGRRGADGTTTDFFAGHWLYYKGTKLTAAISSSPSETVLRVADTRVFSMKRFAESAADDIAITRVGARGKPDWSIAEQVRLKRIDPARKTITVERGAYGTRRLPFPKGSYLAAHAASGPYSYTGDKSKDVPLWRYNLSTVCPRDARGRNCSDALAEYLAKKLGNGGPLATFDGVTFDVFTFAPIYTKPRGEVDINGDGVADGGIINGVNVYGQGALRFVQDLRRRLSGKILLAGTSRTTDITHRAFGSFSGVDSEGFPNFEDIRLDHVSTGENTFRFWAQNSHAPTRFGYTIFKYQTLKPKRLRNTFVEPNLSEDRSYEKLRLILATAQFIDTAFTHILCEPPEVIWRRKNAKTRVFDELWRGVDQVPNWLGKPLGPVVNLADRLPDLFGGQGKTWPRRFIERFNGAGLTFTRSNTLGMIVEPNSPRTAYSFSLRLNVPGPDLLVTLRMLAAPLRGYPASVARSIRVTARRTTRRDPVASELTWANGQVFDSTFYLKNVGPGTVELTFGVEGGGFVRFAQLTARSGTHGRYRNFEKGVVFANPSTRPFTFDLARLFPGVRLRRIRGSSVQDRATNNGAALGGELTLRPKDGLFVVKE